MSNTQTKIEKQHNLAMLREIQAEYWKKTGKRIFIPTLKKAISDSTNPDLLEVMTPIVEKYARVAPLRQRVDESLLKIQQTVAV